MQLSINSKCLKSSYSLESFNSVARKATIIIYYALYLMPQNWSLGGPEVALPVQNDSPQKI